MFFWHNSLHACLGNAVFITQLSTQAPSNGRRSLRMKNSAVISVPLPVAAYPAFNVTFPST
jgi:hypothetical protein